MPTIQRTVNGKVLITSVSGKVAGSCCCGSVNPCPGSPPPPPLRVTVTWTGTPAELVGGKYPFLGKQFGNGDSLLICPGTYNCQPKATVPFTSTFFQTSGTRCYYRYYYLNANYVNSWRKSTATHLGQINLIGNYITNRVLYKTGNWNGTACAYTTSFWAYFTYGVRYVQASRTAATNWYLRVKRSYTKAGAGYITSRFAAGLAGDDFTETFFVVKPPPIRINAQSEGQVTTNSGVTIAWVRGVLPDWC